MKGIGNKEKKANESNVKSDRHESLKLLNVSKILLYSGPKALVVCRNNTCTLFLAYKAIIICIHQLLISISILYCIL